MKKRLCAALLAGLMAFSAIPASAASANMKLNFSYPGGLSPGDTFSVEVQCEDSPDLFALQFTLAFDQEVLDCITIDLGPAILSGINGSNPDAPTGAIIVGGAAYPESPVGLIATLHFKVLAEGDYGFSLCDTLATTEDKQHIPIVATYSTSTSTNNGSSGSSSGSSPGSSSGGSSVGGGSVSEETEPSVPFTDINGHWAEDYILQAYDRGLAAGVGNNQYGPELSLTRAQFVTMLWANAGGPKAEAAPFTDLTQDWYRNAIHWAYSKGYVSGTSETTFSPEAKITREQVAVILRSMWIVEGNTIGMENMFAGIYDAAFEDSASVSSWAKDAVYWAVYQEIWCGPDSLSMGSRLAPTSTTTRAQFAVMLNRYLDL